jgi:hypothetical protein
MKARLPWRGENHNGGTIHGTRREKTGRRLKADYGGVFVRMKALTTISKTSALGGKKLEDNP